MITVQITPDTPSHMLRAIRAACNELLGESHADLTTQAAEHVTRANELQAAADAEAHKAAGALSAHNLASGGPVGAGQFYRVGEQPSEQTVTVTVENTENVSASAVAAAVTGELDSAGQPWNAELHASTKSKNADGTWKKRRGAAPLVAQSDSAAEQATQAVAEAIAANPGGAVVHDEVQVSALPPLPPTPPTASLVTMNDIYALITNGKAVLNDVIAAAQAMGFADVGAFSRDATPEQRAQLLAQLTKEVA